MTPTLEQVLAIEAARNTSDNLLISALAGAAKTTTLCLIAEAIPQQTLCLAFNKRIQLEMQERLPAHCTAMTLNGLGHRIWADTLGRRLTLNKDKTYGYLRAKIDELTGDDKRHAFEVMPDVLRAVSGGKTAGFIPDGHYPQAKRLFSSDEFYDWLDEEPSPLAWDLILDCTVRSLKQAMLGEIDFDDQILMPTVFQALFPSYPVVLVDEAQDLSALNHAMLRKLAKARLIAVGDECQSIYGFRGAHENSMSLMRQQFSMRELTLSISFRCPQSVVREAQWRAPHMRWPDWAKEGEVRTLGMWSADDLPPDAAIICRNNAPLFSMAIALLKEGRAVELLGNDIGKHLIRVMKKLGPPITPTANARQALDDWKEDKLAKTRNAGAIHDQVACINLFLSQAKDLAGAIAYAEHLFTISGPVKLMTGHKSKGLEFPHVFFLDQHLVGKEQQERNLRYVIQTRAQETLTYVKSDNFIRSDTHLHESGDGHTERVAEGADLRSG